MAQGNPSTEVLMYLHTCCDYSLICPLLTAMAPRPFEKGLTDKEKSSFYYIYIVPSIL